MSSTRQNKQQLIQSIIQNLTDLNDFPYNIEQMTQFLKLTKIKLISKDTKQRMRSAFDMYNKQKRTGRKFGEPNEDFESWDVIKADSDKLKVFQDLADNYNITHDLQKHSSVSLNKTSKLRVQIIQQTNFNASLNGTSTPNKPIFSGAYPHSPINNYKEWKKSLLHSSSISRNDLEQYKIDDNYDHLIYTSNQPWYHFIINNMFYIH